MSSIGVRELRQNASEYLRRVENGETFEVTDRGRPIALLSPIPTASPLERLRATGAVEPASKNIADLDDPIELPDSVEGPSAVLERLRSYER